MVVGSPLVPTLVALKVRDLEPLRSSMALDITSWSFDEPVYNSGDTITLTINYTSTDSTGGTEAVVSAVTVTVTDSAGDATQVSDGGVNFPNFTVGSTTSAVVDPTTVAVTDNRSTPGTWTEVSNNLSGTEAPFTGVAVFTSVA
jgi:hypothetical protein